VIGCVVNGPGEAREVDVGVTGGYPVHMIYRDGEKSGKLKTGNIIDQLVEDVEQRAAAIRKKTGKS